MTDALTDLKQRLAEVYDLEKGAAIAGWDRRTMMPAQGAAARSEVSATLSGIEAATVNHPNPTAGAPPLSPPTLLRPSPTRIKVAVSFVVPYSTSPATSLFDLGAATAGNTARRRAPPLAAARSSPRALGRVPAPLPRARRPPNPAGPIPVHPCRRSEPRRRERRHQQAAHACSVLGRVPLARAV